MKTKSTAVESKYTKTPWSELTPPDPLGVHISGAPSWIYIVGAATITMTFDDYAHARHCVNAHDELRALAQAVATHFEGTDAHLGIQARIAVALAKAKREE